MSVGSAVTISIQIAGVQELETQTHIPCQN